MDRETLALERYGKPYADLCGSCKRAIDMALTAFYSGGPKVATIGDVSVRVDGEKFVLSRPMTLTRAELQTRLQMVDQQVAQLRAKHDEQVAQLTRERQAIATALAG